MGKMDRIYVPQCIFWPAVFDLLVTWYGFAVLVHRIKTRQSTYPKLIMPTHETFTIMTHGLPLYQNYLRMEPGTFRLAVSGSTIELTLFVTAVHPTNSQ